MRLRTSGLSAAYRENAPEFIYFLTLYNIFHEFLEDVSEDELPNEATGFRESQVWQMLYNFQRDAMLAIVGKLEKFNGCILADTWGIRRIVQPPSPPGSKSIRSRPAPTPRPAAPRCRPP